MSRRKMECPICTDSYTESKTIICPHCRYSACMDCYKHVILDSINKPCCINPDCKRQFSDDFVVDSFPKVWLNGAYKAHRENLLLALEKARLPETQPHVERRKTQSEILVSIGKIADKIEALKKERVELSREWYRLENGGMLDDQKSERREFIAPCPAQMCRGFLSSRYKCGTCGLQACPNCREKKEDEHKCDPDTVATVEELKKTTRQCPNCMSPIFKTEGCDQMFCTKDGCHTAFNWKTGKVETGVIHNPHYFEWMRRQGQAPRNPNEVQCGGLPNIRFVRDPRLSDVLLPDQIKRFGTVYPKYGKFSDFVIGMVRQVNHIRDVTIRNLPTRIDNVSNLDLRIEYLEGKINEDEFKIKLQRREKDRNKKLDQREILEVHCNVMQDAIVALSVNFDPVLFLEAERQITEWTKNSFQSNSKRYNCVNASPWIQDV